jgi:hypothetical protein
MKTLVLVLILVLAGPAAGQEKYPTRPVDFIVTWGTGGGADAMARQIANLAQPTLGVALPVSNVPGLPDQYGGERQRPQRVCHAPGQRRGAGAGGGHACVARGQRLSTGVGSLQRPDHS